MVGQRFACAAANWVTKDAMGFGTRVQFWGFDDEQNTLAGNVELGRVDVLLGLLQALLY